MKKKILLGLVAFFITIQLIRIDKTNPAYNEAEDFLTVTQAPADMAALVKTACYDCHSHQSAYPWYTNIAPVSWLIANHIKEGRQHLNFSTWSSYPAEKAAHKLEECAEEVSEGEMPMKSYVLMHSEAKMTDAQKEKLVAWFNELRINN